MSTRENTRLIARASLSHPHPVAPLNVAADMWILHIILTLSYSNEWGVQQQNILAQSLGPGGGVINHLINNKHNFKDICTQLCVFCLFGLIHYVLSTIF